MRNAFVFLIFMTAYCNLGAADANWYTDSKKLNQPVSGLNDDAQDEFMLGRSFFTIPWVIAPSATTARDGLGPLFNANTCTSCHRGNGMGEVYNHDGQISRALVTKLSRRSGESVPFYGKQIAVNGTVNVPFEAMPTRRYETKTITYPDGHSVTLKKPKYGLTHLNYGPLPNDTIIVQRKAPALVGLGLLSQVSNNTILTNADPEDKDNDGISGKPNWVINANGKKRLGRYTAKAAVATVREQTADAAVNDMGLTNPVFPHENCTPKQTQCLNAPRGRPDFKNNTLDLTERRLDAITFYLKHAKTPKPQLDATGQYGKALFTAIGCSSCHLPEMKTRLDTTIAPYTDLLLHDMGEELADGRKAFDATGSEFRTAALWGISAYADNLQSGNPHYLHDGRADTLEAAVLWHSGEAEKIKRTFMHLPKASREAIISFLKQL